MEKYVIRKVKIIRGSDPKYLTVICLFKKCIFFYVFRKFSFVLCAAIGQNLELFEWKPHRDSVLGFSYISC